MADYGDPYSQWMTPNRPDRKADWAASKTCTCEECEKPYFIFTDGSGEWNDDRVCKNCMAEIRRTIGEPALDCDLTPEDRRYLQESFGLKGVAPDPQLELDKPFCRSCLNHGANRADYPCLRSDSCGWESKVAAQAKARRARLTRDALGGSEYSTDGVSHSSATRSEMMVAMEKAECDARRLKRENAARHEERMRLMDLTKDEGAGLGFADLLAATVTKEMNDRRKGEA